MEQTPPYIIPIGNQEGYQGTGFIVGRYLITAAHVVLNADFCNSFAIINEKKFDIRFAGTNNRFLSIPYEHAPMDCAIIHLSDSCINGNNNLKDFAVESPLKLSGKKPSIGDRVTNMYYMPEHCDLPFHKEANNTVCACPYMTLQSSNVYPIYDNTFFIQHSGNITNGASGSPVIIDNKVIGIVAFGINRYLIDKNILPKEYGNYCECINVSWLKDYIPDAFESES